MRVSTREKLLNRAEQAINDMYHNATPSIPHCQNDYESDLFWAWFQDLAEIELGYIQGGGAHGGESVVDFVASKYKTSKAQALAKKYYRQKVALERSKYACYENIIDYGKLYSYGRGGRTIAPDDLVVERLGHFQRANTDYLDDCTNSELTDLIKAVESFNQYVNDWNNSIGEQWAEYVRENDLQSEIDDMDGKTARVVTKTIYV